MHSFKLVLVASIVSGAFACSSEDGGLTPDPTGGAGGTGGSGSGGSSGSGGGSTLTASADCNMSGIWVGHQVVQAVALGLNQFANSWYYLEIDQPAGSVDWTITKHFDCGQEIRGTVTVVLPPDTLKVHLVHNQQAGRKGKMGQNSTGQCEFSAERFWQLWGAPDRFLPARNTVEEMSAIAMRIPLPSRAAPDGAEDWDNDGKLGVAYQATGIVSGTRNSVQRSWIQWFSNAQHTVTPATNWNDITVRTDFDSEESTFDPPDGPLATTSTADRRPEAPNRVTLRFLGKTASDPRVTGLVRGINPEADIAAALQTCQAIQGALPASKPD
jgi:hypothetical protein